MFYKQIGFKEIPIGKIPKDWETFKLGDILEETDLRARDVNDGKKMQVLSLTKNFGLIPQAQRFEKRLATIDVNSYKVIKQGWLVYNPYIIWEGSICFLKNERAGLVSPAYVTWKPKIEVDYIFLDYLLKTGKMLREFFRLSAGAVQRRRSIKKEDFCGIRIPLPQIQEQKRIVEILSLVDRRLELKRQEVAKLSRIKNGLTGLLLTGEVRIKGTD